MKLYVYCLVEGVDDMESPVAGIAGAPVRSLKIEDLHILVSDNDSDAVPVTRENALAHAAVVRSVLDRTTPLPFRFGTLVTEEQLRSYVATRKSALETKLAMVRGCIEMSVKIIREISADNEPEVHESDRESGAGAAFLAEKRRAILGDERRSAQAEEISTWLHQSVSGLTKDEQVTVRPSDKLVLAAAHLVERSNIQQYRQTMAEARKQRPELHFLLSGPWPPYSFANIELEFKTQFGVS
jgi:Gas vesicle synthesis protein GvpL/GvpF